MHKRIRPIVTVVLLLVALLSAGNGQASSSIHSLPGSIRLKAATFVPGQSAAPAIPANLSSAGYAEGQRGYYLVQFRSPVQQAWKNQLGALGVDVLDYVPDFAFKTRMTPAQARQVAQLATVGWVGLFHPAYKLSPELKRDGTHLYKVRIERGADAQLASATIARSGAQVLASQGGALLIAANPAQIDAVANVLDVAWVENFMFYEKHNEFGAGAIMGANTANANGYDGSSQTAAVADTGLGGGTAATAHPDIPSSRITAIQNFAGSSVGGCYTVINDGAVDVDSGHGTHVAGSVLGDGGTSGEGKGTAPAAHLVFQSIENYTDFTGVCAPGNPDGYYLIGIPTDLRQLFQTAYDAGARIHSNSWGSAAAGDYTADSVYADDFIWNHRDMTITFSAGNEGIDANSNGVIDNDSIGSPATAKNVITVGASENDRGGSYPCDTGLAYQSHDAYQPSTTCSGMGGNNILGTYGGRWPADYPANPIASDTTAGNQEQMAAFSSRGPTDDGRMKPDVVAPGTWILSTYSTMYQEGYDVGTNPRNGLFQSDGWGMPISVNYKFFGGTSMSNPLTAGAATVVRDYYSKAQALNASAALTKATLINSAIDMLDENNDGANDNDFPIPNVHEGWGRVNVANATDGSAKFADQTTGITTGAAPVYTASVASSSTPLKVSLVWSDAPSTAAAAANLVNDLDLELRSPSGVLYRGNVFSGGWSTTGGSADRVNNVENGYIQSPEVGDWQITVRGFNVPTGPQPFALVVDGATTLTPPPTPSNTGLLNPSANAADTGGDGNGYQTSPTNAFTDNATFAVDTNSGSGNSTSCTDSAKDRHRFYNYGFSIPGAPAIQGIEVRLDAKADSTTGAPKICVQLSWDGGTTWTTAKNTSTLTTGEATYTLGTPTDTWGRTWAVGDFSNANFRVRVINVASNNSRDFSLDWVAVRVTYL